MMDERDCQPRADRHFAPSPVSSQEPRRARFGTPRWYGTAPPLERFGTASVVFGQGLFGQFGQLLLRFPERLGPPMLGRELFQEDSGHRVLLGLRKLGHLVQRFFEKFGH